LARQASVCLRWTSFVLDAWRLMVAHKVPRTDLRALHSAGPWLNLLLVTDSKLQCQYAVAKAPCSGWPNNPHDLHTACYGHFQVRTHPERLVVGASEHGRPHPLLHREEMVAEEHLT
jgi:hypothetical protein